MFPVIMAYFEPVAAVLNKNGYHKKIVQPLKHTSAYLHFLLAAWFGKEIEFYTGINSAKTNDWL